MKLTVLGSTGSIGVSTLDVVSHVNASGAQDIQIVALIAGRNVELLIEQALQFRPKIAVIQDVTKYGALKSGLAGTGIEVACGDAEVEMAASRKVDRVMAAISGTCGLLPTMAAVDAGNDILLANKEAMVCAGPIMKARAEKNG